MGAGASPRPGADPGFHRRGEMGKGPHRAGKLAHAHGLPGGDHPLALALELGVPQGELEAHGDGLGVNPVGASHHDQVLVGVGLVFEDRQKLVQAGDEQVGGLFEAQGQGGVQDVRGGEAEVEVAAVLPQAGGYLVHERGHVVMGVLLDGQDALRVALGFFPGPLRDLGGNNASLRQG